MEQRVSHILDLRFFGDIVPKEDRKLNNLKVLRNQLKNGYSLTTLADIVKPMSMVLVF